MPLPERLLISRIARAAGLASERSRKQKLSRKFNARPITGIGDDCAVLRATAETDLLVTTDFSLEGTHFRREWHPPESVGHRCLARGLSDIGAMGGEPLTAFLSLALPPKIPQQWVDRFFRGLLKLAREFGVSLAGGDTAQSRSGVLADIIVIGAVPKGRAVLRSGAKPGDRIYVTGALGGSAATLNLLFSKRKKLDPKTFPRHFFPMPRIRVGTVLRKNKIPSAMIDISDGLSTDLSHICEMSGVGAEIWPQAIPLAKIGKPAAPVELKFALHGGDDYELLFTAPRNTRVPREINGVTLTCIGEIVHGGRMLLVDESGSRAILKPQGWEHFR